MGGIPWFTGGPVMLAGAERARREWAAGGAIAGDVKHLADLANQERLRRESVDQATAEEEARLGVQEGRAQAQTEGTEEQAGQAASGAMPTQDQPEAPGSTTDPAEGTLHRLARTLLSPIGYMNRTPPGVERPEIRLARLKGQDTARATALKALNGVIERSSDPGAVLQRAGLPGFGPGTVPMTSHHTIGDVYEAARQGDPAALRVLSTIHPGQSGAYRPTANIQDYDAVAGRLRLRLGHEPSDYEVGLVMRLRAGKIDPDLNPDEYKEAARLAGKSDDPGDPADPATGGAPPTTTLPPPIRLPSGRSLNLYR